MSDVYFSRVKLGFGLIGSAGLFWLGMWLLTLDGLKAMFAGGITAACFAYMLVWFARYLLDNKVLSVGAGGIEFHGIVSTRRLRMDQIASIMVETQKVNGVTTRSLVIEPHEGQGGKIKFAERWLEGRFGGCEGVADLIADGASRPSSEPFPLPRRAPTPHAGAAPAGWHEQGAPSAAPERARAGGFGRKGL
ncbi:hypothetical protein [Porphyrobacter sp. YT40]|uniref:hypothetical protein n=1 Tax=Porphyrobacter sp. YT40 TaxID=2547601 RepID=UPI001144DE92|nr:hypothetical protein [Porphyrobacter sp. YT40]QDH35148.1 hypothetical protein E2E27_12950 [Porphyrobacter sp. YT40]